jgi:hypothetical protein
MKQTIRLYVTTRADPVPDLDDMKTAADLAKWKADAKRHALKVKEHAEAGDALIDDLKGYTIKECYAVIAYPPGRITEANIQVGAPMLKFLRRNGDRIEWELDETGVSAVPVAELAKRQVLGGAGAKVSVFNPDKYWDNFTYGLIADKSLPADTYEVDLEAVVKG